jgi:hypothetical protein
MISLKLGVFEDVIASSIVTDLDLERAHAPDTLIAWWCKALAALSQDPRLTGPWRNPDLQAAGLGRDSIEIEVLLCSRMSMEIIAEQSDKTLGVHLISTPDLDPFGEDSPSSRAYRVLVVSDVDEFLRLTGDLAQDDVSPHQYLEEYIRSYLNTVFHEVGHAVLFAENANMLPPNDIESLSDGSEINNDLFDCSTGYGIRPLNINGEDIWADDMENANDLMEIYVETLGHKMMGNVLTKDIHPLTFPDAMGCSDRLDALLATPA